jgi:hypothetical protein
MRSISIWIYICARFEYSGCFPAKNFHGFLNLITGSKQMKTNSDSAL